MSNYEEKTMTSKKNKTLLTTETEKFNLTRLTEYIIDQSCDVINLSIEKVVNENDCFGKSKFGGRPHLPKDFEWPKNEKYDGKYNTKKFDTFIAQFNFEEFVKFDTNNILPKQGMLYIFWNFSDEEENMKFLYYDINQNNIEISNFPYDNNDFDNIEEIIYKTKFSEGLDFPYQLKTPFNISEEEEVNYLKLRSELRKENILSDFSMLGNVPMNLEPEEGFIQLLKMPSINELNLSWFAHTYHLFIWINEIDLKNKDFNNLDIWPIEYYYEEN
jgi:uncharacterized protein YwqG